RVEMKEKLNVNYRKVFLSVALIVLITELIGTINLSIGVVTIAFFPMLYAVLIGILITPDLIGKKLEGLRKLIGDKEMDIAGWAFAAQELGHIVAPLVILPIAVFLGMNREAIGAATSISREPSLGVILEQYGVDSPEGNG